MTNYARAHPHQTPRAVRRHAPKYHPLAQAHALAALRHKATWFKAPAPKVRMTAGRVSIGDIPIAMVPATPAEFGRTEHWADTLLHCPPLAGNRRTVRFAGKPYHWRQDYTGQLKLAAGESPW